jgi:hypothetical protein
VSPPDHSESSLQDEFARSADFRELIANGSGPGTQKGAAQFTSTDWSIVVEAQGERALGGVTTGSYEATLGAEAGSEVNTANNVICIGAGVPSISSVVGEMLVGQDGKLGTQGFNGSQSAVSILQNAHPQSMLNEFRNEQRQGRAIARAN